MEHNWIVINNLDELEDSSKFNNIISKYISSAAGRAALASSMANPIHRSLDYQSISRQIISVQQLPKYKQDISYDEVIPDSDTTECLISFKHDYIIISDDDSIGQEKNLGFGRRVTVPTFEIFNNPTIKIGEIKHRRFDVIQRSILKARDEIMNQEDANIFNALDKIGKND